MLYSSQAKKGVAERLERGGFVTDNRYREIPVANEIARLLLWQQCHDRGLFFYPNGRRQEAAFHDGAPAIARVYEAQLLGTEPPRQTQERNRLVI